MLFIGDVHGKFDRLRKIIHDIDDKIVQIGDLGLGFPGHPDPKDLPDNFKFIRGNHDNPTVCRVNTHYLGDYGYLKDEGIYFISGADSIDKAYRILGRDWWIDEQLSSLQFDEILVDIETKKPRIIVTHDMPMSLMEPFFGYKPYSNLTILALDAIFAIHKPEIWIFGHHHIAIDTVVDGTRFICLPELGTITL